MQMEVNKMAKTEMWDLYNQLSKSFEEVEDEETEKESTITELKDTEMGGDYDKSKCIACGSTGSVLPRDGAMVCTECGTENDINIDCGQEWRYYGENDSKYSSDPTRIGLPTNSLISNSTPSTIILGYGRETFRRHQGWSVATHKERTLYDIYNKLKTKCLSKNLPLCVVDKAIAMYLKCDSLKRGDSRWGVLAACVLYACRDKSISRTVEEIEEIFEINRSKLSTGFKEVHKYLYNNNPTYIQEIEPFLPIYDITRYCNLLKIGQQYIEAAKEVYHTADDLGLVSNIAPKSITLGCIYLVIQYYNLDIDIKELVKVASTKKRKGILDSAIIKAYKGLLPYKYYLIPFEDW